MDLKISKTRDLAPGIAYRVSTRMFVEDNTNRQQQRMLCALHAANLVTPLVRAGDVQLSGFVTDEQLRVVEQLRSGGDLWVNLRLSVSSVELPSDSTPPPAYQPPEISEEELAALRADATTNEAILAVAGAYKSGSPPPIVR